MWEEDRKEGRKAKKTDGQDIGQMGWERVEMPDSQLLHPISTRWGASLGCWKPRVVHPTLLPRQLADPSLPDGYQQQQT